MTPTALLWLHVASTSALAGLIWVVQIVQYPLFAHVSRSTFAGYHHQHVRRITRIVGPLMLVELLSGAALLAFPVAGVPWSSLMFCHALLVVTWASTLLFQIPLHGRLRLGFDADAHRLLVGSNWIRTACWTLRAGWLLGVLVGVSS